MSKAVKKAVLKKMARSKKYNKDGSIRWDKDRNVKTRKMKRKTQPGEIVYDIVERKPSIFQRIIQFFKRLFKI
jgi:hypothetical protein